MNFDLTQPCPECPFRTDCMKGWLGEDRAAEIISAITDHDGTFACHKTVEYDNDGQSHYSPNEQHCAGAMILLEKLERPNQLMRIAERIGHYDHTKLLINAPVFDSARAFIRHHSNARRARG